MAFISEIHYRNNVVAGGNNSTGTTIQEYIEVTLTAAEAARAGDFVVATYQRDGEVAAQTTLSSLTPVEDPVTGFFVYQFVTITTDPDNSLSNPPAIALVDNSLASPVLEFVDIGGGITEIEAAVGTPAAGAVSTNIPAATGETIQFDINGNRVDGDITVGTSITCFTEGTMIETPEGFTSIETLKAGDLICTLDAGPQPIRWVGSRQINNLEMLSNPNLRPVILSKEQNLKVSRHHRILVTGKIALRMFGTDEVLVPAKDLVGTCGVELDNSTDSVRYFHILLDAHHLINANGIAAESLYLGPEGVNAMTPAARKELQAIFPKLSNTCSFVPPRLCRKDGVGRRVRQLGRRHQKNNRLIVTAFEAA